MGMMIVFFAATALVILLIYEQVSGRSLNALIISCGFLLLGMMLMIEHIWLGFLAFWAVRLTWQTRGGRWAFLPAVVGVIIISAHFAGWKVYGSPELHDNRPLFENSLMLDHLEMPNVMVASDGSRHALKGVRWVDKLEFLSGENIHMLASSTGGRHLRFVPSSEPDFASGYAVETRNQIFCGNSFFPSFFPRTIPAYRKEDAARVLRSFIAPSVLAESH